MKIMNLLNKKRLLLIISMETNCHCHKNNKIKIFMNIIKIVVVRMMNKISNPHQNKVKVLLLINNNNSPQKMKK